MSDENEVNVEESGKLPDGSGFAVVSMPLPDDHWIYTASFRPPMPFRMGEDDPRRAQMSEGVRAAGRYAVAAATVRGKESDFDPDALIQNLIVGMFGYFTSDGLSDLDPDENPRVVPPLYAGVAVQAEPDRKGFRIPDGHEAVVDADGRATGDTRPVTQPAPDVVEALREQIDALLSLKNASHPIPGLARALLAKARDALGFCITDATVDVAMEAFNANRSGHDQWACKNSIRAALVAALSHAQAGQRAPSSEASLLDKMAAIADLTERLERAETALGSAGGALHEFYRYWTGGETRGSYDGKPERDGLWRAMHEVRSALAYLEGRK